MMNKMMKKIAIAAASATMMITAAFAASANETKYVSNSEGLNVREEASADSTRLGGVYQGDAVDVIDYTSDGWARINYNGRTAYVRSGALSYTRPSTQVQTSTNFSSSTYYTVSVPTGYLALRNDTCYDDSNIIGRLYTGDKVLYISSASNGYAYVYAPSLDRNGYVIASYIH